MKKFLAIDTSSTYLTVLAQGEKSVCAYLSDCAMNHSVKLLPTVEETLSNAGMGISDFDFFACVTGAGSFTGIRIGIATIKGCCTGEDKPCLPVTSFDLAAYTMGEVKTLTVLSAGHNYFYICGYDGEKRVILPPAYCSLEEAAKLAEEYEKVVSLADGQSLPFDGVIYANPAEGLQKAVEAKSKDENNFLPCEELRAVYVRKSQAEENRK